MDEGDEMTEQKMRLFEIYVYLDQNQKTGFGGHVRFVAAPTEKDATHKVAFGWGHWWRTCGIREVDSDYWRAMHASLPVGKSAYNSSVSAFKEFSGIS